MNAIRNEFNNGLKKYAPVGIKLTSENIDLEISKH